jgi:peptide/nickel transport system substrate-binding protein
MLVRIVCATSLAGAAFLYSARAKPAHSSGSPEELLRVTGEPGQRGGRIVIALRSEPKTLNPLTAADAPSREVISAMQGDLVHINRASQLTEPALAKSWRVSADGLQYTVTVRQGLKFSDGQPVDIEDVLFTFRVYLDEAVRATQRDLLIVGGKPITVRKLDSQTVLFTLARPYGAGERLFDGLAILPRHLLETAYKEGKLSQAGALGIAPTQWAGLGAFRLKEYVAGQKLVLERNPFYWKSDEQGNRLPYLDEIVFVFVPSTDAQVLRFQSGETDMISRLGAENFTVLSKQARDYTMSDAGPSLEYNFLFFNLNESGQKSAPEMTRKQSWFRSEKFRQAVSVAIDRDAIVRLVYQGRGAALWGPVTPGNPRWIDNAIGRPQRSVQAATQLLTAAGFRMATNESGDPRLFDQDGKPVEFSIVTSASNADRAKMAALIQEDLRQIGMQVQVVPLELRSLIDRVTQTKEYDACVLGIASFDADPNSDLNVWLSSGGMHLWNPAQKQPATEWEAEIDRLMQQQLIATNVAQRKKLYDRVQEILAERQPMIFLATPDILVGAKRSIGNFHPAIIEPYVLWNVEQMYQRKSAENARR